MPDRRENIDVRTRLEAIQVGYERWTKYTIRLLTILFLIQLGLGLLAVYLVGQNQKRGDETRRLVAEVYDSRKQSLLITCREQNIRHDKTIATLHNIIETLKPRLSASDRANLAAGIEGNIKLIDAIAPREDCDKRASRLLGPKPDQ